MHQLLLNQLMKIKENNHQWYSWHQADKLRDQKINPPGWTGNVHLSPN